MHILVLPSWYFPPGSQEIAGRMFHQLTKGLREEGVDARILYADYSTKGPLFKKTTFIIEDEVSTWRTFQFFPPKANEFLFRMWITRCVNDIMKYIDKEGKPDLIHAHSYLAASVCAELQHKMSIPFIYTERLSGFILGTIPKHHYPFLPGCFELATAITCVSPGLLSRMDPHSQKPIRVIPNFYDEEIFYTDTNVQKNNTFTWVSIGEPAHIKGLDILFRAFAALKEKLTDIPMQLILIDRISEKEDLIKQAQSLGIEKDIVWTELITQPEIATILRKSHVLISASRVETFGKAIIEAQACGLPVVATKTDGAEYILTSSQQGELADIGSPESLMHAMGKVYTGYPDYDAQRIHRIVEKRFSKKVVIHQWIKLYQSIQA
jgi:glycosyltransferase involved in cell wall biosynthesis